MLKHVLIATLAIIGFFASCESPSQEANSSIAPAKPDFLKKYKATTVPVKLKGCLAHEGGLPLIPPDSLIADNEDGSLPYCTFKTNGNYYAVIRLGLADCVLPSIKTYDLNGALIDEKEIFIGDCGCGPGFHCEEYAEINKDFSIYVSDTISEAELDSLGEEIKESIQTYIIYKKGKLLSSGKIELSDRIRKKISN